MRSISIALLVAGCAGRAAGESPPGSLSLAWASRASGGQDILTVSGSEIPGGKVEIWYLEAYCRSGSRERNWRETVIPHHTELVEASPDGRTLRLRCRLPVTRDASGKPVNLERAPIVVDHVIRAGDAEVSFEVEAKNRGTERVDAVWAQPCIRVGDFTGGDQTTYVEKSFIFVGGEMVPLPKTHRSEEARYRGGQVYVPAGIDLDDVNPRPVSPDRPANGLIGCTSRDGKKILATAWEPYQELFQGVIVCLHSDFRLGGLGPGETKKARGKLYVVDADVEKLLARYRKDFPEHDRLRAHVEELKRQLPGPGFTVIVEPPFVVIGDEPADTVRERSVRTVRWAADRLREAYFEKSPEHVIDVWLFKDKESYEGNARKLFGAAPHTPFGYYSREHRALVMDISTGGGTLVHEMVHAFMEADFPEAPAWFNEGLASLHEQCDERGGRIRGLTNWRLDGLQEAIRAGKTLPFEKLTRTTSEEFYAGKALNYAQARYLCYYLQEKGLLEKFYRAFRGARAADPTGFETLKAVLGTTDMNAFEKAWKVFVLGLTFR